MEVYKTEEEQFETIKSWLKKHGGGVILGIIVLAGLFGGRALWVTQAQGGDEQIYVQFETVSKLRDTALKSDEDATAFQAYVKSIHKLKSTQPDHVLTNLAVLKVAADFAQKSLWDEAETELRWLKAQKTEPALESLVVLRLAQVLFQKNQLDPALELISQVTTRDDDYLPRLKELEGDLYMQQKQPVKALKAYEMAVVANTDKGLTSAALQWKIDDLAGTQ